MSENTDGSGQGFDPPGEDDDPSPLPGRPRRKRNALKDARGVRSELSSVYWAARQGELTPSDAAKLAHILDIVRRAIQTSDLSIRVELLEQLLKQRDS